MPCPLRWGPLERAFKRAICASPPQLLSGIKSSTYGPQKTASLFIFWDMGKAWTQATGLSAGNAETIGAIAGLLLLACRSLPRRWLAPGYSIRRPAPATGDDPPGCDMQDQLLDQVTARSMHENWPDINPGVTPSPGFVVPISLLALLSDRGNPTVGEALGKGLKKSSLLYNAAPAAQRKSPAEP